MPAKCFKPVPKVKSCLVALSLQDKERGNVGKWEGGRERLMQFLELFAPFSRKTLGAIQTMINKKSVCTFVIPDRLKKKRLEELSWEEINAILDN